MILKLWLDMFYLNLPLIEKVLRPVIVYAFLVIILRLAGKRELAQINPFDLVVLLTLSNTVQNAIIGNDNSVTGGLIGAATLIVVNYLVVRVLFQHPRLEKLAEGEEAVLVQDGQVLSENLRKEAISLKELEIVAHKQGFESLKGVRKAVLDPGGVLSFTRMEPEIEEERYREVIDRFDQLIAELTALRGSLSTSSDT